MANHFLTTIKFQLPKVHIGSSLVFRKAIFSTCWLVMLLMTMLVSGPASDWVHERTSSPGTPLYVEPPTPTPTTLNPVHEKVLAAQMDRETQYKYLQSTMNAWDLDCFDQAREQLRSYKNQPHAFDRYVASLWTCAYTGRLH